jgi:hypothetical protein
MIAGLSAWAAQTVGGLWPLLFPLVGVLGTFVTGSATASHILFSDFQQTVAKNMGLPVLSVVGAQGFGAAVGNIVCPHNTIAGGATVGAPSEAWCILQGAGPCRERVSHPPVSSVAPVAESLSEGVNKTGEAYTENPVGRKGDRTP